MKKILLATTALAAVSVVSAAQAQESNMMSAAGNEITIGGFYEFGYTTFDEKTAAKDTDKSFTYGDSELILDFENTADSGLTYGVHAELEIIGFDQHKDGAQSGNTDEANIYLSGDFGRVNLGHQDGAFGSFVTWAPTHSGATSQDDNAFYGNDNGVYNIGGGLGASYAPITGSVGSGTGGYGSAYNDDAKIGYFSPNFSGFSFGVSIEDNDAKGNPSAFGAKYSTELGDVGVLGGTTFGLSYAYASNGADKNAAATESSIGASVGLGDLSITVSNYSGKGGLTKDITRKNLEIGVGYQITDSISVGLSRSTGTAKKFTVGDVGYKADDDGALSAVLRTMSGVTTADAPDFDGDDLEDDATSAERRLRMEAIADSQRAINSALADSTVPLEDEATYTTLSGSYAIAPGLSATLAINQFEVSRSWKSSTTVGSTTTTSNGKAKNDGQEVVFQVNFAF